MGLYVWLALCMRVLVQPAEGRLTDLMVEQTMVSVCFRVMFSVAMTHVHT